MSTYRLTYFDGRGLGEASRYLLTLSGAQWEEVRLPVTFRPDGPPLKEEFDALKASGALPFDQVPLLEVDGKKLAQSKAIERYLARTFGLYGATTLDSALIDSFSEGVTDFKIDWNKASYWAKAEEKEALQATFFETTVPKHLGLLERNVVEGDIHLGDVHFAVVWEALVATGKVTNEALDAYPKLKARWTALTTNEKIAKYLAARKVTVF